MVIGFNWVDIFIVLVVAVSILISLIRGFVREALSLVGWILSIWVAFNFCHALSDYFMGYMKDGPVRLVVAFFILLAISLIIAALINHLVSQLIVKSGLSSTDRVLGVAFGLGRGVLLVSLLLLLGQLTPLPADAAWRSSLLVPTFRPVQTWLVRFMPIDIIPNHRDLSAAKTRVL